MDTIASAQEHPKEAMRTTIVGGVVVKTSVQQERNKAIESATKPILVGGTETLNRPKVIKAGYAVKQGAVVSVVCEVGVNSLLWRLMWSVSLIW